MAEDEEFLSKALVATQVLLDMQLDLLEQLKCSKAIEQMWRGTGPHSTDTNEPWSLGKVSSKWRGNPDTGFTFVITAGDQEQVFGPMFTQYTLWPKDVNLEAAIRHTLAGDRTLARYALRRMEGYQ